MPIKSTPIEKFFLSISFVLPLIKGFSIKLRKLTYTGLLFSTLFFVRCGVSDALKSIESDAVLNKINLNNEYINKENLNKELTLYLGEKFVFNIPNATELFDADENNNNKIKAKITNQEDKTLVTFVIEGNTLTIDPRKIGSGTFTLDFTTSYNNLGIMINSKIKKVISDSFTKKINYRVIQNLNKITIPIYFPKTFSVAQHIKKTIHLPAVLDRLREAVIAEIVQEVIPTTDAPKLTVLNNILTIISPRIGSNTIKLRYKSLDKIHTDERLYTSTTKFIDIIIITVAQTNTITIPTKFPTTFTVTQNEPKTLTLPMVTDSLGSELFGTENEDIATLNGNLLNINSPTIGTKNIILTYRSQSTYGRTTTTQTKRILIITVASNQNRITIPTLTTTFTVTQNTAKTLTLPTVTDTFNTAIIPTVNDPVATLNRNALIITSPTIGTKSITLTYTSQAINGRIATTQTTNIHLVTVSAISLKNELKIVYNRYPKATQPPPFKGFYPINVYVGPDQRNAVEIITFQDVADVDVVPTFSFNSPRFSLNAVKDGNKYKVEFQYIGGTGNEEVLVDIIWTTQEKNFNGKRYNLVDSYTNSIRVKLTDQWKKTFTFSNGIIYYENRVKKLLKDRDGEVIKINLKLRTRNYINTLSIMSVQRIGLSIPTLTLNNEGDSSIIPYYSSWAPPGIRVTTKRNVTVIGSGVIKVVYKSRQDLEQWDVDKDGALDNVIYASETVTIYIEVNGAKKDEATFPII